MPLSSTSGRPTGTSGVFHSASEWKESEEFVAEVLAKDKVDIVVPNASIRRNTVEKLTQFYTEKLLQSQRRLTKLYGRDMEIQVLKQQFEKLCGDKRYRSLVLIGGMSGEGKTALALQLQKSAHASRFIGKRPIFVLGKYDLATLGEPYSGIKAALGDLCRELSKFPVDSLNQIRKDVQKKLSWETDLLCQLVPELRVLKSGQQKSPETENEDATHSANTQSNNTVPAKRNPSTRLGMTRSQRSLRFIVDDKFETGAGSADRLKYALRKLINVVTSLVPLVFVCDDSQWAGNADLSLMQAWITDEANQSLLLIWTYRKNMVGPDHKVSKVIKEIQGIQEERSIDCIHTIDVGGLQEADVGEMIADTLDVDVEKSKQLTKIIHHKTCGNVFFVRQYLLSLARKGFLSINMATMRWDWDEEEIRAGSTATENVVDLMKEKVQLCAPALKILPLAALLGATFDTDVLDNVIQGMKEAELSNDQRIADIFSNALGACYGKDLDTEQLEHIERDGLIEKAGANCYSFIHDKVIEGSLAVIPEDQLDNLRFGMGLVLFDRLKPIGDASKRAEESAFLLVNLLNAGLGAISPHQKPVICQLNLEAGDKAFAAAAYSRSADYYAAAIKLLPQDHWESMFDTSMQLYIAAAESEMCLGNYEHMQAYAKGLLERGFAVLDQLPMYKILIDAHTSKAELQEAWYLNDDVLRQIGFQFPRSGLKARTKAALLSLKLTKKRWKPDALSKLPVTEDPMDEAISQLSDFFIIAVQAVSPDGFHLAIITHCRHILDRGLNKYAAVPLAWLGLIIINKLGDFQWAKEHAEFTHNLLQRLPNRRIETQVAMVTNIFVLHWTAPIHNSINPLIEAYSRGMETCDLSSGFWCAQFYHEASLYSGKNLALLQRDAEIFSKQEKDHGMLKHLDCIQSVLQLILNLRGQSNNTIILSGSAHDEPAVLEALEKTPDFHHLSHLQKDRLFAAAFFSEFEHGADLGMANVEMICHVLSGQHSTLIARFAAGLCCFVMARKRKKKYLKAALQNLRVVQTWFEKGNPNAQHYLLFLKAEKAVYEGKQDLALAFYDRTIVLAGRSGYNHDRALACERRAEYFVELGDNERAKHEFQDGLQLYGEWGAAKKVELLRERVQCLLLP